ncbi:hypothetical protein Ahy_A07g031124 [Arachis hypogaea]|uniref:Uncharacterized protein n=1 Tax=Arachis hypogaea TaxID=3818 RepID=A0A445C313_ARAHY|nr:hypothetical protein Ahy_A07g031124 [Arachis hypogaea]
MLCLLETHLSGPKANKIAKRFGFSDWFLEEGIGFSEGIWILWNSNFWNVEVLMSHKQYVHMKLRYGLESPWFFTVVYGSPQIGLRTSLWEGLKSIADNLTSEWCVGGDFNCVLSATDTGGNSGLSRDHDRFADCLLECGLQDLGFKGQSFTWQKGIIRRRLDRYVTNAAWSQRFSSAMVLRSKYRCGDNTIPLMKPLQRMSNAWKGISHIWKQFERNLIWRIGSGQTVNFWKHHWIPGVHCLMDFAQTEVTSNMRDEKVYDYVVNNNWNYDRIGYNLGDDWFSIFASIKPPEAELGEDSIAWMLTPNGVFSIKPACSALASPASSENASLFTRIWKLEAPQRLRSFCWLVANNALLTNEERVRRNIAQSALCGVCGSNSEYLLHVLRDCPVAYRTWKSIDDRLDAENFFTKPLIPWLMENLSFQSPFKGVPWPLLFTSTLNFLWFRRNTFVFDNDRVPDESKIHEIAWYMAQDYHRAHSESMRSRRRVGTFAEKLIKWQPPPPPFIKLNSDGSVSKDGRAACGGILRDSNGQFLACYSANLGACTVTAAELWGILFGLELIINLGHSYVEIEVDSAVTALLCSQDLGNLHSVGTLVSAIKIRCNRLSSWTLHHEFREANSCADKLASFGTVHSKIVSG